MNAFKRFYKSVLGDQITFRNTSREWLYGVFLLLVCLAAALAYVLRS